ncbi:MAG: corrinoid protein [Candidatus Methylomirabilia bacterium]
MVEPRMVADAVTRGGAKECARLAHEALDGGLSPYVLLSDGLMAGLAVIAEQFKNNEVYVPEVLVAAKAMKAGLAIVQPRLAETGAEPVGKVVIGTVKGDLHDIGKTIVSMMLEGAGFQVVDLGNDVAPERFVQAVKEQGAQILGMSALLTTTRPNMEGTIKALRAAGGREKVKVMVGGAPLTERFANAIGADAYAENATVAVEKAKELLAFA